MKPIREGIQNVITFPQFPSIMAQEDSDDDDNQGSIHMEDIAEKYLRQFASISDTDKTFGLHDKNGKFFIRNKETKIKKTILLLVIGNTKVHLVYESQWYQQNQTIEFILLEIMITMLT